VSGAELERTPKRLHPPGCACVRCEGFAPGNLAALRHGCYSPRSFAPRAEEIAAEIYEGAPWLGPSDSVTVTLLARTLARVERADAALQRADEMSESPLSPYLVEGSAGGLDRLRRDLRSWVMSAARQAAELGLSAASRARLGVDVARARSLTLAEMHAEAAREGE